MSKRKKPNKEMLELYRQQKDFGCILCRVLNVKQDSVTEIHHLRDGMGMSQRGVQCIPLCVKHHRINNHGYHGMGRRWFEAEYHCNEKDLLSAWEVASGIYPNWTEFK